MQIHPRIKSFIGMFFLFFFIRHLLTVTLLDLYDNLSLKKKNFKSSDFEIRFHLEPNVKIMKTQDGKSILIDIKNEGWKFTAQGYTIDIETGLYFGKKNSFTENQNLFISGITQNEDQIIKWEFEKII